MSSSFIYYGLTIDPTVIYAADMETVIAAHADKFVEEVESIDYNGQIRDMLGEGEDNVDGLRKALVDTISEGLGWLVENWEEQGVFNVPGDKGHKFVTGGGDSWGDSPFDEYDALIIAANAAEAIPEFGKAVGLVGGGITIDNG